MFVLPIFCLVSGCLLPHIELGAREPWDRGRPAPERQIGHPAYPQIGLEDWGDEDEDEDEDDFILHKHSM